MKNEEKKVYPTMFNLPECIDDGSMSLEGSSFEYIFVSGAQSVIKRFCVSK